MAAASPVIENLDLAEHGLRWVQAPAVLARVMDDGRSAVLRTDVSRGAASLDEIRTG